MDCNQPDRFGHCQYYLKDWERVEKVYENLRLERVISIVNRLLTIISPSGPSFHKDTAGASKLGSIKTKHSELYEKISRG